MAATAQAGLSDLLTELRQDIKLRGGNAPLEVHVDAHLFLYEVAEGLARPNDPMPYNMIYDKPCSIILNSISVGAKPKREADNDDHEKYFDDEEREEVPDPDAQFREGILSAVTNQGALLGHIRIVLWVLAIFLLLSFFI